MIYLDYAASSPPFLQAMEKVSHTALSCFGNPGSIHQAGANARKILQESRFILAQSTNVRPEEIFFTSGGTEANNWAVKLGCRNGERKHILVSATEHKSVIESASAMTRLGYQVSLLTPDRNGVITPDALESALRPDTALVCIQAVNNETGVIQPINMIGEYLTDKDTFFHVDATQSFGKLVDELKNVKYNMLSMSAHKIGGPQGVGTLVLRREKYKLPPVKGIMYGGQQEHGIRPGTIPVALVAGLGKACELAEMEYKQKSEKCKKIKDTLLKILVDSGVTYQINGDLSCSVPNTLNVCFDGVSSEALMLSSKQYCGVSNGSACNSNSYSPSFVLVAMGVPIDIIESSIRVSWGAESKVEEIASAFTNMVEVAKGLAF